VQHGCLMRKWGIGKLRPLCATHHKLNILYLH
jgi:hypothetical protein